MSLINSYLFYGIIFLLLSVFQVLKRKWLLEKWYKTYNLDQPDSNESMKKLVVLMQNGALIVSIIGCIFFVLKGLKLV